MYADLIIPQTINVREALELINSIAIPNMALFIVNEKHQLIGSITDGDIRRGLLKGNAIDEKVDVFMNKYCKYLLHEENNFEIVKKYKLSGIRFLPLINEKTEIIKIIDISNLRAIIPVDAVIMAGGKGERLKPLTDSIPKPMLKIGNTPIIVRNIERLSQFGVSNFTISVRHMAHKVIDGIGEYINTDLNLNFIEEKIPLGTIGSVKLIEKFNNNTVLLMNSDLLTNIDFDDFYQQFIASNADMQVATIPYHIDVPYAVMDINDKLEVTSFSEKPRYTHYTNAGIYLFKTELIDLIPENIVFDATHFMEKVIAENRKLTSYPILGYWLDIGRIEDFYKAQEDIKHLVF